MLVYFNEKFVNENKAQVSVNNRSFRYGDGLFETIKVVGGRIINAALHTERLFDGLGILRFEPPSFFTPGFITSRISELVHKNQHQALARVRVTVYRGEGGIYDSINHRPLLLIQSWPLNPENNSINENGLVLDFYTPGLKAADAFSSLKNNNYLLYAMAALQAKQQRCNDLLISNTQGRLADATIANLWMVHNDRLITPPLSEGPVAGTMRRYLLLHVPPLGYTVAEEPITHQLLAEASEVFLTNAIYGIRWVKSLGPNTYTPLVAHQLHERLIEPLWG